MLMCSIAGKQRGLAAPDDRRRIGPICLLALAMACVALPAWAQEESGGETPAASEPPVDNEGMPTSLIEARAEYDRLMEIGADAAAIDMAEHLVDLTELQFGERSHEAAEALLLLGRTERSAGEYDDAEISLLAAIDIYREIEGFYSGEMIEPLTSLGDTYYDAERYENAVSAYTEARTVHRRVYGLLSTEQIALIDKTTDALQEIRMLEEAHAEQLSAMTIVERVYEPGSEEVLQAIYKYAEWLMEIGSYTDARTEFNRAIAMIEDYHGDTSPLLIEAYRRMAASYRSQGIPQARGSVGMTALRSALEVLETQDDPDPLVLAGVLLDLGDAHTAGSGNGTEYYLRAWDALEPLENADEIRQEWFAPGMAIFITKEPLSTYGLSSSRLATEGRVVVVFDIDDLGRPHDISVVESDPEGFKDAAAIRAMRQSRFRPRLENRQIVPARRKRVEYTFRYLPEELD